jgi:hypothetical protein
MNNILLLTIWSSVTILTATAHAELNLQNSSPLSGPTLTSERWLQGCSWLGRNDDEDKEDDEPQCSNPDVCNAQHEFIASVLAYNDQPCECNVCGDVVTLQCNYCTACGAFPGKNSCIEAQTTVELTDLKNGNYTFISVATSVKSSGKDSASNHVVVEITFAENIFNGTLFDENTTFLSSDDAVNLSLDGVTCQSISLEQDECSVFDCRNIDPDYYWTCNDGDELINDTSNPLHGFITIALYCPMDDNRLEHALSEIRMPPPLF